MLRPHIDYAMVDALNYRQQVAGLFRQYGWEDALTDDYARKTASAVPTVAPSSQYEPPGSWARAANALGQTPFIQTER